VNLEGRKTIDITPVITEKIAVFPGDTSFKRNELLSFKNGNNLVLSSINTTVHLGAHTDAPSHYHANGDSMEKRSLSYYMGGCQVIEVKNKPSRILPQDLEDDIVEKRVLFKTGSFPDPNNWNDDFSALSPQLIEFLHSKGVLLVGIDTPSVDPADDKELLTHNAIYKSNMAILEGIVLQNVAPGCYDLIALPLPLAGADASPVRAVLLEKE
jgi:arylformamidase